jgi:hypothetical protein
VSNLMFSSCKITFFLIKKNHLWFIDRHLALWYYQRTPVTNLKQVHMNFHWHWDYFLHSSHFKCFKDP